MTSGIPDSDRSGQSRVTIDALLTAPSFALLHRPNSVRDGQIEVLFGDASTVAALADLKADLAPGPAETTHRMLAAIPYRQVAERGFDCIDDGEPIRVLTVTGQATIEKRYLFELLP